MITKIWRSARLFFVATMFIGVSACGGGDDNNCPPTCNSQADCDAIPGTSCITYSNGSTTQNFCTDGVANFSC